MTRLLLSAVFALALALVIIPGSIFGALARVFFILASFVSILNLATGGWHIRPVEWRWGLLCMLYILAGILSASFSPRPELGFLDAGRQFFIVVMSIAMLIHFRRAEECYSYRRYLALPALLGAATIIGGFLLIKGLPTPENLSDLAAFKFEMDERYGVNPNPLSFAVLLVFVLSWREQGRERPWWFFPYVIFVLTSIVLSGARTSLIVLVGALAMVRLLRKRPSGIKVFFAIVATLLGIAAASILIGDQDPGETLFWLSDVTTGRSELWGAALAKFVERPLLGWGAMTWDLDLPHYLTLYSSDMARFEDLGSGAFHSAYLTQLAEKGLLGFGVEVVILVYLMLASLRIYWQRDLLSGEDRRIAVIAPTWTILLLLRGFSEQGGLLGYANAGVDFIAYAGAALILSTYGRCRVWRYAQ